ncbi:MAG: 3-phosphoserine/phosphohydroxythreonine transaminase [Firmicutes bacterium]|nr:3-phosphoserine/phosphohydroxythreonine transaminase [Bacillota bacterium]
MRVYNFSAGPSMLPLPVLEKVQKDFLSYGGTGMSVTEMSHRSKPYEAINAEAESLLRKLMGISEEYDVIFIQGGASTQFEAIPLNLCAHKKADYVVTGVFSEKAFKEAGKFTDAKIAASSKDKSFTYIPRLEKSMFRADADYVHICYNNTIIGTRFRAAPDTGAVPLIADMSSMILSEEVDVSKFSVIYAGAQKNIAPAGVTIVIVKKGLANAPSPLCPTMLKWQTQINEKSLYNTPPAFSTYMAMEVFKWLDGLGGVKAVQKMNEEKANLLYDFIDNSAFYQNKVEKEFRSIMNVPFVSPSEELDNQFVSEAAKLGLIALKGHRLVGGMRASIYNAMPKEGIKALIEFMKKFEKNNK